jgi:uncharacterized phage protein gp47/JayE
MPFSRPTLAELREQTAADIELNKPGANARKRGFFLTAIANMIAGIAHGLYGKLEYIERQMFDVTADPENLRLRAAEYGILPIPAAYAEGDVRFTGNAGVAIPAGVVLQAPDGTEYTTTAGAVVPDPADPVVVGVRALQPGVDGNRAVGETLLLKQSIPGIVQKVLVLEGGIAGGADEEGDARLLVRLQERKAYPPGGGNRYDYARWGKAAHVDVSRVWVFPHENGAGSIVVRFVADALSNPIPAAAVVAKVSDHILDVAPKDIKDLTVVAPTAKTVNIELTATSPDTTAVRAAIEAELRDFFKRAAGVGEKLYFSQINEAISLAQGEVNHVLVEPAADVVVADTEFPVLGTITYS